MRVVVDRARCVGSGSCVEIAPAVFDQDDLEGTVRLRQQQPPEDQHERVRRAVFVCAASAISVEDDDAQDT
jgi:ferredoxin